MYTVTSLPVSPRYNPQPMVVFGGPYGQACGNHWDAYALVDHWGETQVGIFELAPLRRQDVAQAAQGEGLDAETFLARIESSHAGALAARPVTLGFLLRLDKEGRPFPATRVDLYREGCELLCAGDNETRRTPGRRGNRTPSERMTIAARIAAVLCLSKREAVWIGPHAEFDRQRDCSVNDLVGRAFMPGETALEVSQDDLFEGSPLICRGGSAALAGNNRKI